MCTILIVDDDQPFRLAVAHSMRREGYIPLTASDGKEALAMMEANRPSLVLLDLALPRVDGIEMLRQMRQTPALATVPVVIVTAASDIAYRKETAALGVKHYLLKSLFSLADLRRQVVSILGPQPRAHTA